MVRHFMHNRIYSCATRDIKNNLFKAVFALFTGQLNSSVYGKD
jgi:hypothetical protein